MTQPSNAPSIPDGEARETVLDALDRLEKAATEGPWTVEDRGWTKALACTIRLGPTDDLAFDHHELKNAALIAFSRNHLRALIEVARAAEIHAKANPAKHDP